MEVKVKRGAVKVGNKYIETGETAFGLTEEDKQALVTSGTAEYILEQTKEPETGDKKSESEGNEEKSGTTDLSENSEKAAKGKK